MPNYVSKGGVFYPAKEHAVLPHLSGTDKEVYDGPDRAAEFELAQAHGMDTDGKPKVTTFGIDFRKDPEFVNRVRQMGYKDINEYLKDIGYDEASEEEKFNKLAAVIVKHKEPDKKPASEVLGGGKDFSGQGKDKYGGFGSPQEISS
jgi:hypothetical protein